MTESKAALEVERKRYMSGQFDWHLTNQQKVWVEQVVTKIKLQGGRIKRPFKYPSFVKSHDWITLGREVGIYVLGTTVRGKHGFWIVRFFNWICRSTSPVLTRTIINELEVEIGLILVEMEELFPLFTSTINFHLLSHLPETLRLFGPCHVHNMYSAERFNRAMKAGVKVRNQHNSSTNTNQLQQPQPRFQHKLQYQNQQF
jgi:hypothetical protein